MWIVDERLDMLVADVLAIPLKEKSRRISQSLIASPPTLLTLCHTHEYQYH